MSKETVVTCPGCGAGVLVRPGKGGALSGECPLCSTKCSGTAPELSQPSEEPTGRKKGGAHA